MKKKGVLPFVALILALIAIPVGTEVAPIISRYLDYQKADKLLSEGAFEEARALYQQLDGYKDSVDKISQCNYEEADKLFSEDAFEDARALYQQLDGYKDSAEKLLQCNYAGAEAAFAEQDYAQAYRLFFCNTDYQDSAERASECFDLQMQAAEVGDIVYIGSYEQDGDTENGEEPIAWSVLRKSGNNLFLISESIVEKKPFGYPAARTWEASRIRHWLNNAFYQNHFSSGEKALIQKMITSTTTDDHVFLLSAEEANGFFTSDDTRIAHITSYVKDKSYYDRGEWWTRSTSDADSIKTVAASGCVDSATFSSEDVGIRPAICINILGETSEEAQNVNIFGADFDSNIDVSYYPKVDHSSHSASKPSTSKSCPNCNGTGYVKYYYGSSDLEAILSGHDPYTTGKCTMCGGTGKR